LTVFGLTHCGSAMVWIRHCEERSDAAIHLTAATRRWIAASPSAPRNDDAEIFVTPAPSLL
jgi:hypothetical protein